MPRGKSLSAYEKGIIDGLSKDNQSARSIARGIGRSVTVVLNYIKDKNNYNTKKRCGRPRLYSKRDERRLIHEISVNEVPTSHAKNVPGLPGCRQTAWRTAKRNPNLKFKKKKKKPKLTKLHKELRLSFAKNHMSWTTEWTNIIFSDEKRFNLDGPDGYCYYWHDIRKEEKVFLSRQQGGGGLSVWAAMGYNGTTELVITNSRMNSYDYVDILSMQLPVYGNLIGGDNFWFQQDNCSFHTSKVTRKYFKDNNIRLFQWPSRSPDLSPIENVWGILVRYVYGGGRQFNTITDLKQILLEEWEKIPIETFQKLIDSMPNRIFEVIQKNGGPTHY